jgi:hypothetical protein
MLINNIELYVLKFHLTNFKSCPVHFVLKMCLFQGIGAVF